MKYLALYTLLLISPAGLTKPVTEVIVDSGRLSGAVSTHRPEVAVFRGIRYAQAPLGALRWQPPRAALPWRDTRRAIQAGAPCVQPQVPETSIYSRGPIDVSEDCLFLNVWTGTPAGEDARPVLVWFHGGGNSTGHGASLIFDGANLAAKGAVVVTANYRLGALGFLAHPALVAESANDSSGNYALLDQIAVLRWVRENIQAFGGDPQRVVIFGQSAGALDVCLLMVSPLARDLFSGVIAHSGGCLSVTKTLQEAAAEGASTVSRLGVNGSGATAAARLRALSVDTLLSEVDVAAPIIDGWVVPASPRELFADGDYARVPLVAGAMADEFRGLTADLLEMSMADYEARVRENFANAANAVLETYAPLSAISPREAFRKISTHSFFAWQSRAWARLLEHHGTPAYLYSFTYPTAVFSLYVPDRPEFPDPNGPRGLGAYHSGDLAYHFANVGLVGLGWRPWDHRLADVLASYWVTFAATGNPNREALPVWPAYQKTSDTVQAFGTEIGNVAHPERRELNLFDDIYGFTQPSTVRSP